jgi:hypothetical protein
VAGAVVPPEVAPAPPLLPAWLNALSASIVDKKAREKVLVLILSPFSFVLGLTAMSNQLHNPTGSMGFAPLFSWPLGFIDNDFEFE